MLPQHVGATAWCSGLIHLSGCNLSSSIFDCEWVASFLLAGVCTIPQQPACLSCRCVFADLCCGLQGLFERHKLIVATQLCMAVLRSKNELQRAKFEFLLHGPKEMGVDNPLGDWVSKGQNERLHWDAACIMDALLCFMAPIRCTLLHNELYCHCTCAAARFRRVCGAVFRHSRSWRTIPACQTTLLAAASAGGSGWSWKGQVGQVCVVGGGLFRSVVWPCRQDVRARVAQCASVSMTKA